MGDRAVDVAIEGREGGELYELTSAGEKHIWGTILLWDPPNRVGFTWHPGRDVDYATEVEVTFRPAGGMTEVSLRHRGWEKLREKAEEIRANYQSGWGDLVGRRYREAAERERAESA